MSSLWKKHRLKKSWQFQKTIKEGKVKKARDWISFKKSIIFTVYYIKNNSSHCFFGISSPKKLIKLASKRNFYKRQIRSMLISFLKTNNCWKETHLSHNNFVIIVGPSYSKKNFETIQEELYRLINFILYHK